MCKRNERNTTMLKTILCSGGLCFGILTIVCGTALADAEDIPGQVCKQVPGANNGLIGFDTDGVRNNHTSQKLQVVCPIALFSGVGRSLFIGGTDNNSSQDFLCFADGWDVNLTEVFTQLIQGPTGTYTNGTIGWVDIPDNVVKLNVQCMIPFGQTFVSKISDFYIQN
jgi:hypothetical protein